MANFRKILSFRNLFHLLFSIGVLSLLLAYLAPYIHPETIPIIPFFGLVYPVIFTAIIFLLIIAIFRKSRWAWVISIVILIGFKLHFRTFAWASGDDPGTKNELRILSYNVKLFDRYNAVWDSAYVTKDSIFSYLTKENPDIVCFQEFYQQDAPTSFVTKDSLLSKLNMIDYHERFRHKRGGRQNFGICMMSRFPIIEKGYVLINPNENLQSINFCIYSDIVARKDTLRVYNVHLQSIRLQAEDYMIVDSTSNESVNLSMIKKIKNAFPVRAKQAKLISSHIRNSPYHTIVCGDFNDTPLSYSYNQFNSQLVDAFRNSSSGIGKTYAGSLPAGRIDYIFHSPSIGSNDFNIQEKALSDHYAISCDVFIKDQ